MADIHLTADATSGSKVLEEADIDWTFAENGFLKVTQGTRIMAIPLTSILKVEKID
ncbi:MAG: hypothetical protein ABSE82_00115 [Nitrososphaerales archaeon]|jgi:hypothetical protein